MKTAHIISLFALLIVIAISSGCGQKQYLTLDERLVISEGEQPLQQLIDNVEISHEYREAYPKDEFLKSFLTFWRKGDYATIYELMADHQGLTKEEFSFLARNAAEAEQIQNISIYKQADNIVKFEIYTTAYLKRIPTEIIKEEDGWLLNPFYIFTALEPEKVCADRANTVTLDECNLTIENPDKTRCRLEKRKSCLYAYAVISGDARYCNHTANLKGSCLVQLGYEIDLSQMIADCYAFPVESEQANCMIWLARTTKDVNICKKTIFERAKYECYGILAAAEEDVTACEKHVREDGFSNQFRQALCVLSYVKETGDHSKCGNMPDSDNAMVGAMIEECSEMMFG